MRRSSLAALMAAAVLLTFVPVATVTAANGDNLRTIIADRSGTDCTSLNAAGDHASVGVGIAFDGTNLLISCYSDNTITAIDPADGSQVAIHTITGASSLGALAWDQARGLLWACSSFNDVGTIDLATNAFTFAFTSESCFDGLAYDGSDDTLWSSGDVYTHVEHYTVTGTLLSTNPVALGGVGNSGIAVGGPNLYLANNGASQIYEVPKDFSSETLFATFPARLEDLECDNLTFAPSKAAIWSIDAYDNVLNAWEIPAGACAFGGGGGTAEVNDIADPDAYACGQPGFIDFEDLADGYNLSSGAIGGVQFTTTSGFTWLVGDFGAGGYNGKYPSGGYTSKGTHWAWLGVNAGAGRIDFVNGPASTVSLLASVNLSAVSLDAYDASDSLLATAGPSSINYNTGHMDELKITRPTADIAYVVVHDTGNFFLVDALCTDAPGVNPPANTDPVADAGGPYAGNEGSAIAIAGSASDADPGDVVTTAWTYTPGAGVDAGATCSFADASALATTVTCTDDGTYTLTLTADDGHGGTATSTTALTVGNVAPTGAITAPADGSLFAVGTNVTVTSTFSDPGANDTHACEVDWDAGAGFEAGAGGLACGGTHAYAAAGIYTVTVRVTDDDGGVGTASIMVVVYDPSAGFVTGGGWINSPAGAYAPDASLIGKATFGFVSKYKKGTTTPDGSTEFQFHAASFNFHSTAYEWLVVNKAAKTAQFKGTGTVNGSLDANGNPYRFMLWAGDGTPDTFRIRVWSEDGSGEHVVYDNGSNQAIASGSVIVHTR